MWYQIFANISFKVHIGMQYGEPIETPHFVDVTGRKIVVYVDWARSKCFSAFCLSTKCLVDRVHPSLSGKKMPFCRGLQKLKLKKTWNEMLAKLILHYKNSLQNLITFEYWVCHYHFNWNIEIHHIIYIYIYIYIHIYIYIWMWIVVV